jgi:hypothetical protein
MTEFNLPESTNSFCDNESELCQSSKIEDEILFNNTNMKSLEAKMLNAESTLSTKYSESAGPVKPKLLSAIGNTTNKTKGK